MLTPLFDFADENSPAEEHDEDVELTPPLLEEAVNLLLVNKTVMSCILVLQNKRGAEKIKETTTTELPTVIHAPLKVRYLQEKHCFPFSFEFWPHRFNMLADIFRLIEKLKLKLNNYDLRKEE